MDRQGVEQLSTRQADEEVARRRQRVTCIVRVLELARKVAAALGREAEIVAGPEPPGATPRRCPDISRMRALGYAPKVRLDDGLPGVVRWYAENRHLRPAAA